MKIKRLESGWWLITSAGPCEFAQVPDWPCDEQTLRKHAFPEASETFIRAVLIRLETSTQPTGE